MKRKWIVEFEIDDIWIADGFDLTSDRALDMLASDLSYATEAEIGARVIAAPDPKIIAGLQDGTIDIDA